MLFSGGEIPALVGEDNQQEGELKQGWEYAGELVEVEGDQLDGR